MRGVANRPVEWAYERTKRGLGLAVRWAIILLVFGVVVLAMWGSVITAPFGPYPSGLFADTPRVPAIGLTVATLLLLGVAWFFIKGDVHGLARGGGGTRVREAMGAKMIGVRGEVTGTMARTTVRVTNSALDVLTPVWAAMAAPLAAAWWSHTELRLVAWAVALLGLPAGWLIARRVGAIGHVNLTWRDVTDREFVSPEFAIPGAVLGGIVGYFLTDWLGGVTWVAVITMTATGATMLPASLASLLLITQVRAKRRHAGVVAAALGINSNILENPVQRWQVKVNPLKREDAPEVRVLYPLDEKILTHLPDLNDRVAQHAPQYQVDWERTHHQKGVWLIPCGPEEYARRQLVEDYEGLVVAIEDLPDTHPARRQAKRYKLAKNVGPTIAGRVDALAQRNGDGRLVEWDPDNHEAIVAPLSRGVQMLRKTIADKLPRAYPHDIELTATMADGHIDTVDIYRYPATTLSVDKELEVWRTIVAPALPGGHPAWGVHFPQQGQVQLLWRKMPELPSNVDLARVLPGEVSSANWQKVPIGVDPAGEVVDIDFSVTPHGLVVGPSGSGKTVCLATLVSGALMRNWKVIVADPQKKGTEFASLRPYCTAWAVTAASAGRAVELAYQEGQRRGEILRRLGLQNLGEMTAEQREQEDMHPLLVVYDEYGAAIAQADTKILKGFGEDDPRRQEMDQENSHSSLSAFYATKIAKELRYAGVHLVIGNQSPLAEELGGTKFRANLAAKIQLIPPEDDVDPGHLGMVFGETKRESAIELLKMLDDGRPGFGLVSKEGGKVKGYRVAYRHMSQIPELLETRGVKRVDEQWDLTPQEGMERAGSVISSAPSAPRASGEPQIIDRGTFGLSMDDLEAFTDEPAGGGSASSEPDDLWGTEGDPKTAPTDDPFNTPAPSPRPARQAAPVDPFDALADPSLYPKPAPADDDDFDFKM